MRRARPLVFGVNCLPPFHSMGDVNTSFHQSPQLTFSYAGLYGLILSPLHSGNTVVMFAPSYSGPPTPDATLQVLQQAKADVIIVPPVFVELWSSSEIAVAFLADSDRLVVSLMKNRYNLCVD
jgi:acyl-coenzyme A synthetase/AMP-(fatty) acid ligase